MLLNIIYNEKFSEIVASWLIIFELEKVYFELIFELAKN